MKIGKDAIIENLRDVQSTCKELNSVCYGCTYHLVIDDNFAVCAAELTTGAYPDEWEIDEDERERS